MSNAAPTPVSLTREGFDALFGGWGESELDDAIYESRSLDRKLSLPLSGVEVDVSPAMLMAGFKAFHEVPAYDVTDLSKPATFYRIYVAMERVRLAELELELASRPEDATSAID